MPLSPLLPTASSASLHTIRLQFQPQLHTDICQGAVFMHHSWCGATQALAGMIWQKARPPRNPGIQRTRCAPTEAADASQEASVTHCLSDAWQTQQMASRVASGSQASAVSDRSHSEHQEFCSCLYGKQDCILKNRMGASLPFLWCYICTVSL